MTATQFTIHDAWADRTDIDIPPPARLNMFRQTRRPTELSFAGLIDEPLRRAVSWFDSTFKSHRDSTSLLFFSIADAATYMFRWQESAFAAVIESKLAPLDSPYVPAMVPDAASIPGQITDWLGITYDQLASITGISRATFFYWRRPGIQPRPDNALRLQGLYSLTSLLVRRLGVHGARMWLRSGKSPAWNLLMSGDLAGLDARIRNAMFPDQAVVASPNRILLGEVNPVLPSAPDDPEHSPHRSRRQPKRGRLGSE